VDNARNVAYTLHPAAVVSSEILKRWVESSRDEAKRPQRVSTSAANQLIQQPLLRLFPIRPILCCEILWRSARRMRLMDFPVLGKRSVCTVLTGDLTSPFATGSVRVFSRGINLVSVDFFCPCALDSLVEPLEQLSQRLAGSSLQHGQSIVTVGGDRYTSHGIERAHGDFAIGDKLSYVR